MTATTHTAQAFLNGVKRIVPFGYAEDATVNTPNSSYTVKDLIGLIEAAQNARMGIDSNTIGKASSVFGAPTDIFLSNEILPTGSDGSSTAVTVGTLSATSSSSTLTFALVTGTGSTNNSVFSITGTTLKYTGSAASAGTLSIRVRVTDSASQTFEEAITITVA